MTYDREKNTQKKARYRLRKRMREQGYSEDEIEREIEERGLYDDLAQEIAPAQDDSEYEGEGSSWPFWAALGVMGAIILIPAFLARRAA